MEKKKNTKQLLVESLLELSKVIPIEKISVKEIVQNCGVGRQSFYNHFHDKYDLIEYFYASRVDMIIEGNLNKKTWKETIIDVLQFFYDYRQFFKSAIIENGQLAFINIYYEHTKKAYINFIISHNDGCISDSMLFLVEFNCFGAVNMVKKWLLNNMNRTPEALGNDLWMALPADMKTFIECHDYRP